MKFTFDDVKRVTRELLEEYGEDYVYQPPNEGAWGCTYSEVHLEGEDLVPGETPSCILGHIAFRLDPELFEDLARIDVGTRTGDPVHLFEYALGVDSWDPKYLGPNPFVRNMFDAQRRQDSGEPWGKAVEPILEA